MPLRPERKGEISGRGGKGDHSAQRKDDRERKGCMENQNPALGRFCTCSSQVLSQPNLYQKGSNGQKEFLKGCFFLWSESHPFPKTFPTAASRQTAPAPMQSSEISKLCQCRTAPAGHDKENITTAWPGFTISPEEILMVSWLPRQGLEGREATTTGS